MKRLKRVGLKIYTSACTYGLSLWYTKLYWVIERDRETDRQTETQRQTDRQADR